MISKKKFWLGIASAVVLTCFVTWSFLSFVAWHRRDPLTGQFRTITGILERNSYYEITDASLQNGAIQGMISGLSDTNSQYLTAQEVRAFENQFLAEYSGIGVQVTPIISGFQVLDVVANSPADLAGIQEHDIITAVNNQLVYADFDLFFDAINTPGTKTIVLTRDDKTLAVDVKVEQTDTQTSFTKTYEDGKNKVVLLDLQQFTDKTVADFKAEVERLAGQDADVTGVILDLRNNQGGSVEIAKQLLEAVVSNTTKEGEKMPYLITQNREQRQYAEANKAGTGTNDTTKTQTAYYTKNTTFKISQPTVILMNEHTASAAEMVAAALHEIEGIPLIGSASFGKGTIQELIPVVDNTGTGGAIKLTTQKWFTPTGQNLTPEHPLKPLENNRVVDSVPYTVGPLAAVEEYETGDRDRIDMTITPIKDVQVVLNFLGVSDQRTDGIFDDLTANNLRTFQKNHQLTETGKIDAATLHTLNKIIKTYLNDSQQDATLQKALTYLTIT